MIHQGLAHVWIEKPRIWSVAGRYNLPLLLKTIQAESHIDKSAVRGREMESEREAEAGNKWTGPKAGVWKSVKGQGEVKRKKEKVVEERKKRDCSAKVNCIDR